MTETLDRARPPAGTGVTEHQNSEYGFVASDVLLGSLQAVLVDLIELHVQSKQAHWNVVGPNFRDLHLQLDEIVEAARAFSDEVAERMRALHAMPDGRSETVSSTSTLPPFPAGEVSTGETIDFIVERIESVVRTMRTVHDGVDEEDPTSADVLHAIIEKFEQFAWMVGAENREPQGPRGSGATGSRGT